MDRLRSLGVRWCWWLRLQARRLGLAGTFADDEFAEPPPLRQGVVWERATQLIARLARRLGRVGR